jgi:hypothetical protein
MILTLHSRLFDDLVAFVDPDGPGESLGVDLVAVASTVQDRIFKGDRTFRDGGAQIEGTAKNRNLS